jgi:tight adherence protein C
MADRSDSPAVGALVNALRRTEKFGTPLANSLRVFSLMGVPLMVFLLPTRITVLLLPAILSVLSLT